MVPSVAKLGPLPFATFETNFVVQRHVHTHKKIKLILTTCNIKYLLFTIYNIYKVFTFFATTAVQIKLVSMTLKPDPSFSLF